MAYSPARPLRGLLPAAFAFAVAVSAQLPAAAQQSPKAPGAKSGPSAEASVEGMPLYTSDGKAIGKVIAMGLDEDNLPVLVAEIERQLGFGAMAIAVPTDMFVRKSDRIELTIPEAEVNNRLRQ